MIDRLHAILRARTVRLPGAGEPAELLARDAPGGLEAPDRRSANRQCRLLQAQDGWVALNLARPDDRQALPALIGREDDGWTLVAAAALAEPTRRFRDRAAELQFPVAVLGEAPREPLPPIGSLTVPRRVVDMSALWAGPLCAGLLARGGAEVLRVHSSGRPDPTPQSSPGLDRRINAGKSTLALDLTSAADREQLHAKIRSADVLVTSARPAALARLGLAPRTLLAECPQLTWVAITAHGFAGAGAARVGFGDDCAVAGGLVRWVDGAPQFLGDALADPLSGVEAALAALSRPSGGLIDIAMARVAAGYALELGT